MPMLDVKIVLHPDELLAGKRAGLLGFTYNAVRAAFLAPARRDALLAELQN